MSEYMTTLLTDDVTEGSHSLPVEDIGLFNPGDKILVDAGGNNEAIYTVASTTSTTAGIMHADDLYPDHDHYTGFVETQESTGSHGKNASADLLCLDYMNENEMYVFVVKDENGTNHEIELSIPRCQGGGATCRTTATATLIKNCKALGYKFIEIRVYRTDNRIYLRKEDMTDTGITGSNVNGGLRG